FKFLKLLPLIACSFIVRSNNNISLMAGTIRISIQKFLKNKHCITSITIISLRRSIVPRILFVYRFFKTTHFKWAIIVSVSRFQSRFHRGIAIIPPARPPTVGVIQLSEYTIKTIEYGYIGYSLGSKEFYV